MQQSFQRARCVQAAGLSVEALLGRLQPRFRDHPFRAVVTLACRAHRSRWCWSRCCSVTAHMLVWLMPDGTLQHLPGSRHPGWR